MAPEVASEMVNTTGGPTYGLVGENVGVATMGVYRADPTAESVNPEALAIALIVVATDTTTETGKVVCVPCVQVPAPLAVGVEPSVV